MRRLTIINWIFSNSAKKRREKIIPEKIAKPPKTGTLPLCDDLLPALSASRNLLAKKMKFTQQTHLYLRIQRLISPKFMGKMFKVILAYKFNKNNFAGFK